MNIKNNCRRATCQIEKSISGRIHFVQKMELIIHLARCPECRLYREQSKYIHQMATSLLNSAVENAEVLDEEFKNNLEKIIINKVGQSDDINLS